MMRLTLFFDPLDVLLFRDPRPFDAGVNHLARGVFPPPQAILGCVRTALFLHAGADFRRRPDFGIPADLRPLLGSATAPAGLHLRGPFLTRFSAGQVVPYLPPPRDLVITDSKAGAYQRMRPLPQSDRLGSTWHFGGGEAVACRWQLPVSREQEKHQPPCFLTTAGAAQLLDGKDQGELGAELLAATELYQVEVRPGIARDNDTLTAQDHMLYTKLAFRMKDGVGFAADIAAIDPRHQDRLAEMVSSLDGQVVALGGKGHRARIRVVKGPLLAARLVEGTAFSGPRRRVWFVTPTILDRDTALPPSVVSYVMDRPQMLGGYDLAAHRPRPLRRAAPAGTVLYLNGGDVAESWRLLQSKIDDYHAGHGVALLGGW